MIRILRHRIRARVKIRITRFGPWHFGLSVAIAVRVNLRKTIQVLVVLNFFLRRVVQKIVFCFVRDEMR